MMASRIIAQILVVGGGYFVRAFIEAYRQALQAAPAGAAGARQAAKSLKHKLSLEEAAEILSVSKDAGLKDIAHKFDKLYSANDPSKGGSQYIQYKLLTARNALYDHAIERGEKDEDFQNTQQQKIQNHSDNTTK
uniref:Mitochondrial import inner membrane translocase subunit TIM16 n=1 Tax=Timspurckia oligopyrenoides TaxID=708627 RepID=A0A7S0ZG57_9RHOD|mmetsp:Transcript_3903/g.6836  ORF Transcript_3903/g.6836 Transcript_3903/m.6836 type:complete len:135 (+) Transcript_3903:67-471(+)